MGTVIVWNGGAWAFEGIDTVTALSEFLEHWHPEASGDPIQILPWRGGTYGTWVAPDAGPGGGHDVR